LNFQRLSLSRRLVRPRTSKRFPYTVVG
jgi:hypothetical protein